MYIFRLEVNHLSIYFHVSKKTKLLEGADGSVEFLCKKCGAQKHLMMGQSVVVLVEHLYKVGPYQITPIRRVASYNPSYPFIMPFIIEVLTPFITGSGPTL